MADLVLNARFLMRPMTGVDRVAVELMCALDRMGLPDRFASWRGLRPRGAISYRTDPTPRILQHVTATPSRLEGQLWEQWALNRAAPEDWLLSLCNLGPVLRKRQIVMMHDAQVFRQPESYAPAFRTWYRTIQPKLGHRAAMVLTVSEHSKSELEYFGVVPPGKARVVPNGADHILREHADTGVLERYDLEPNTYFLALGSSAPHKNLSLLLRAFGQRTNKSVPLVIAGGGGTRVFAGSDTVAAEDVRILHRVRDPELRALYENATGLLFPSLTEGFGLPPIEAMMCGCPVIASNAGALPETCGQAAMLLDPHDAGAWAAAMDSLVEDRSLQLNLSDRGRRHAAAFTWANAAALLSKHLKTLPD